MVKYNELEKREIDFNTDCCWEGLQQVHAALALPNPVNFLLMKIEAFRAQKKTDAFFYIDRIANNTLCTLSFNAE